MDSYQSKRDRDARLRKIVLHSADSLPDEVTAYVVRMKGSSKDWQAKDQILKEYLPLARSLPTTFVDFVLEYLVERKRSTSIGWPAIGPDRLGIRRVIEFFPASPVQGPFLYLLREHEQEGLRLVHGLVNAATENWREAQSRGRYDIAPRTAIPLEFKLQDSILTFWGDESVYCWFRGTTVAPDAVVSALMALEMWIEQQLSARRDIEELFRTVLRDAQSVAIVAVLVSAALAHPGRALSVVEPFVADARIWHMDIVRFAHDAIGTPTIPDFLGRGVHADINHLLSIRNNLPQRRADIRWLLIYFLFDARRTDAFDEVIRKFGDPLPFQFTEETGDLTAEKVLRGRLEDYRSYLDRKNYEFSLNDTIFRYRYIVPTHVLERDKSERDAQAKLSSAITLKEWARKSFEQGSLDVRMTADQVIQSARALHLAGDLETPITYESQGLEHLRREAILEVISAVLSIQPRVSVSDADMGWFRTILLSAAFATRAGMIVPTSIYPSDPKVSAALGLGAIVAAGEADQEIREAILHLIGDEQNQVVGAVFRGLREAWTRDPVLCWHCFFLSIALSCTPKKGVKQDSEFELNDFGIQWLEDLWSKHLDQLQKQIMPFEPNIGGRGEFYLDGDRMTYTLDPVPVVAFSCESDSKDRILRIHHALMSNTVEVSTGNDTETDVMPQLPSDYEWETNFLRWSARVTSMLSVDEEETHVIRPIWATWPKRPRLLQLFLEGYLHERMASSNPLADQVIAVWDRIWKLLLHSPEFKSRSYKLNSYSLLDQLETLAVFVVFGKYWWKESWPHAARFEGLVNLWVREAGDSHVCYHALVTMLKPNVRRFALTKIIDWLEEFAESSKDA